MLNFWLCAVFVCPSVCRPQWPFGPHQVGTYVSLLRSDWGYPGMCVLCPLSCPSTRFEKDRLTHIPGVPRLTSIPRSYRVGLVDGLNERDICPCIWLKVNSRSAQSWVGWRPAVRLRSV